MIRYVKIIIKSIEMSNYLKKRKKTKAKEPYKYFEYLEDARQYYLQCAIHYIDEMLTDKEIEQFITYIYENQNKDYQFSYYLKLFLQEIEAKELLP